MTRAVVVALALLAAGCAHVEVEPGARIEVRTLGAVEVEATPTRVEVKGAGISSAFVRLASFLVGLIP